MTNFSMEASLFVKLDQSSLRESRRTLEDELTADPIEVEVKPVDRPGSAMEGLSQQPSRTDGGGRSQSSELPGMMAGQTALLKDVTGSWEENLELNTERNSLLESLKEAQEQDTYNRAARVGGGLGGVALAGMIGIGAAGLSALSNFEWPDLPKLEAPTVEVPPIPPVPIKDPDPIPVEDPDPVPTPEPNWTPLGITKPDWLPLTDPTGGGSGSGDGSGTGSPSPLPDDIQNPGPANEPWVPPASDDTPTGQPSPIPDGIQQPGPVPGFGDAPTPAIEPQPSPQPTGGSGLLEGLEVNAEDVVAGVGGVGVGAGLARGLSNAGRTAGGVASLIAGLPGNLAARSAQRSQERPEEQQTFLDRIMGDVLEAHDLGGSSARNQTATAAGAATIDTRALSNAIADAMGSHDPAREQSNTPTKIEHSPTYNVESLRELERQQQQARRELEQKIKKLEEALGGGGGGRGVR